jgi:alanyl-tRNA synthetase
MMIKILSNDRVQEGVERLVFTSGMRAVEAVQDIEKRLSEIIASTGSAPDQVVADVSRLRQDNWQTKRELKRLKDRYLELLAERMIEDAREIGSARVVTRSTEHNEMQDLIELGENLVERDGRILYIGNRTEKGTNSVVVCGSELVSQGFDASQIAARIAELAEGGSSGDESFARAGGSSVVNISEVAEEYAKGK